MKKVLIMATVTLFARLLAAEELDIKSLAGENWYGMYMGGQKAGYSVNTLTVEADGKVSFTEDAVFGVRMAGVRQDMRMFLKRVFNPDGTLLSIYEEVDDEGGKKIYDLRIEGERATLITTISGTVKEQKIPKPKESLKDAFKQIELIKGQPTIGKEMSFSFFEPMFGKEMTGKSRIEGVEERVFEGAPTKVYRVKSDLEAWSQTTYVAENGMVLEDQFAGMLVIRLEPKEVAKDVNYSNDVIVSNAVRIEKPIENPREREVLKLRIEGPFTMNHLIQEERQSIVQEDGAFTFTGRKVTLDGYETAKLPVQNPEVAEWLKPTLLVQSEDPRLVAKAKEIVQGETDTRKISDLLCAWVYRNVRTTYSARLSNSLEVLDNPEGDCTEHSMLFVGLARAAGVPAREAAGLIYVADADPGFYFHQWASVWVGKWIDVDPTFDQPIADATHIKLAQGDLYEQAKLIPVIGKLKMQVMEP